MDEETQAPEAQEEAQAQPSQTTEAEHDTDVQEAPAVESNEPEPAPEVTTPQVAELEADEEEELFNFTPEPISPVAPFDISQLPTDADGNVLPDAFQAALAQHIDSQSGAKARAETNQLRMEMQYEREWDKAVSKYPELRSDKELQSVVRDQWMAGVLLNDGKGYQSPEKVASRIQKLRGAAKAEGIESAKKTVQVQSTAHLETSETTAPVTAGKRMKLKERISAAGNQRELDQANLDYLKDLITAGDIQIEG